MNFKPGQSGNPAGRPPMPEEIKQLRKTNRAAYELLLDELMWLDVSELRKLAKDESVPAIKMCMAAIIAKSISFGDHKRFGYLLEQMIGKALVRLEATGKDGAPLFAATRTPEERRSRISELTEALAKIHQKEADARSRALTGCDGAGTGTPEVGGDSSRGQE